MLNRKGVLIVFMFLFAFVTIKAEGDLETKYRLIEKNLLVGLNTDNLGLKVSAAYFLGEIKSSKAVIPLMHMLKNSGTVEERLIAALSLAKIRSERGMFAVKQRIKFDDSERVKRICKIFYNNFLLEDIKGDVIVEPFEIADLNLEYKGIKLQQFIN